MVMSRGVTSQKSRAFSESVIREMTRLCLAEHGSECVNLAQGFPDFAAPSELKEAAIDAIRQDFNQYATTWGAKVMRDAIADKTRHFRGMAVDPETEITVCCGVTEAMLSTILAVVDPGDEVIIFEPFYENYGPDCILSGATPVVIPLVPPTGASTRNSCARRSAPRPGRSSSTPRTIRPARSTPGKS